ncbi:Protein-S-isoprenylcysteine O-methyltransferase Ste14 [Lentzea albidocapillata subsp. violacea]|uniref:Protein-S-isoprenylcysteine O-methyltransferase Ste14 n=1 Tax=Lentzea albidocapillata subsp. violacea TaxID=128104 RepID=A0A1H0AGT3_9PSEU|nr:isoprenylcysteine carboxylmethyltransferase family protein [Lentzea albidocapillata]SDN31956.1 Protein-S-isoprenylcysteine O-methyltransferase Ste14 [Lentzea albidocapillata subsp. violacea]
MAGLALGLCVVYLALAFGWRSWAQWRATGSTGFRGIRGRVGSVEWWGGALFALSLVLGLVAPALQLADVMSPVHALDGRVGHVAGVVLSVGGIAATLAAQRVMGASWRIGVDPAESTALVTDGLFAHVRNPVFTAMIMTGAGLTALAPNVIALIALVALVVAVEIQVRVVEEPYLLRTHGQAYATYASRAGRFLPGVG